MSTSRLDRINELAQKKKTVGITPEEEAERRQLHKEYIAELKKNVKMQLDNVYFVDENGNKRKLNKKK